MGNIFTNPHQASLCTIPFNTPLSRWVLLVESNIGLHFQQIGNLWRALKIEHSITGESILLIKYEIVAVAGKCSGIRMSNVFCRKKKLSGGLDVTGVLNIVWLEAIFDIKTMRERITCSPGGGMVCICSPGALNKRIIDCN